MSEFVIRLGELPASYHGGRKLTGTENAVKEFREIAMLDKEVLAVLFLTASNTIIKKEVIHIGTINSCIIYPRAVAKSSLINDATSVVMAHNHPGGGLSPSFADADITDRVKKALDTIGVCLTDHLVVTEDGWASITHNVQGKWEDNE